MSQLMRFGRKIALPSTRQIRHELIMLMLEDEKVRVAKAAQPEVTPAAVAPSTPPN